MTTTYELKTHIKTQVSELMNNHNSSMDSKLRITFSRIFFLLFEEDYSFFLFVCFLWRYKISLHSIHLLHIFNIMLNYTLNQWPKPHCCFFTRPHITRPNITVHKSPVHRPSVHTLPIHTSPVHTSHVDLIVTYLIQR